MTVRRKFVIAFASIAFAVAAVVGIISYSITRHSLSDEIDRSLVSAAGTFAAGGTLSADAPMEDGRGGGRPGGHDEAIVQAAQKVSADGSVQVLLGSALPVDTTALPLARAYAGVQTFRTVTVGTADPQTYRILYYSIGEGAGVIQVARDLDETQAILGDLALNTVWIGLAVVIAAAGVGWVVARQITRRLTALTAAAERVSSTGYLDLGVQTGGHDEVTRLGTAMQGMLAELARSRDDQQRLVQDAGHELRTPLTSLRTNISVLNRFDELPAPSRQRLIDDVHSEARELTNLVNELVELATDQRDVEDFEQVDLVAIADRVAALFRRRSGREIIVSVDSAASRSVRVRPDSVQRALSNLVDNALKFDQGGTAPVEIEVSGTTIRVADRGPGLENGDAERIFDRFYRATTARSLPGSGLGLSIVADVAVAHGGSVSAAAREGGGTVFRLTLDGGSVPSRASSIARDR